ncbi:multidrug resistance protein EbrA [Paenibacillus sp. J31TS4]|uniref:DMT family transporter n=1 Tax=Paenibacillus sp. J31TS4 TaxID=2807195 RepID=UPI001B1BFECA|nr:multidrug efflux SMR transporter [Paenibacillus sp. J31TS4]GIP37178.1 multidrug resistance protein EbrA [Paenibacillus sp. J31TS4]
MIAAYLFLAGSIVLEVFGSTMLKLSNGFTRLFPSAGVVAGYGLAFYLVARALQTLPLGMLYATWSGTGTVLTAVVGVLFFRERLNKQALLGIAMLVAGIVGLNIVP